MKGVLKIFLKYFPLVAEFIPDSSDNILVTCITTCALKQLPTWG